MGNPKIVGFDHQLFVVLFTLDSYAEGRRPAGGWAYVNATFAACVWGGEPGVIAFVLIYLNLGSGL